MNVCVRVVGASLGMGLHVFDVFMEKHDQLYQCSVTAETLELTDKFKEIARSVKKIANNCKTVNYKNSLMKECKPLFTVYSL